MELRDPDPLNTEQEKGSLPDEGGSGRRWGSDRSRGKGCLSGEDHEGAHGLLQNEVSGQDVSTTCKSRRTPNG